MVDAQQQGTQINQIHKLGSNQVLISGSNIPTTALQMNAKTENGIESVEIMAIEELNKVISEPNEVLAYERNAE